MDVFDLGAGPLGLSNPKSRRTIHKRLNSLQYRCEPERTQK
jgi:hypothetical protein